MPVEVFDELTAERSRALAQATASVRAEGRSGRPYSYKTIADILSNPVYIGTVLFRDVEVEDAHPGIIDRDTFDLASGC